MTRTLSPPIRVAVVGAGYFGQFHYDAWSRMPEVELVGLCVRHPEAAAETAERYGKPGAPLPIFTDAAEMCASVRPGLVDLTAPPAAHLETIRALAPYMPDVICQKPYCD
ncbi:MAG: Gfo/Idh/MocA family oxidoreductase, partial [Pseudomonadota bacterium]